MPQPLRHSPSLYNTLATLKSHALRRHVSPTATACSPGKPDCYSTTKNSSWDNITNNPPSRHLQPAAAPSQWLNAVRHLLSAEHGPQVIGMVQVKEQKAFGGRGDMLYRDPGLSCLQAMFLCTLVYITVGVCGYTAFKDRYHLCLQICTCAYISATVRSYASHAKVTH